MVELGELEKHHAEFDQRGLQLIAVSNDNLETTSATQADFPHLVLLSDEGQDMARHWQVIHPGAAVDGGDTNAPTIFLIDDRGTVRTYLRPKRFMSRYSPEEVIAACDATFQD